MLRTLIFLLGLAACAGAVADTPLALTRSFAGNVNFTGTEVTLRTSASNNKTCNVYSSATGLSVPLSGIPASATILSAQLYWAGSGSTPDYTVGFEGASVSAPTDRRYSSATIGSGFDYFSGAVDVTAQVAAKRNGNYLFYGLSVDSGEPYCSVEGVLGGFSLLVVYSDVSQPFRVLNLYEGFQYVRYSTLNLSVSNFRIPTPLPASSTARIGHITWEGDAALLANGEELRFNGVEMTDALNPAGNQFNSKSNIDNDAASFGIDFDAYDVAAPIIQAGQTTATTSYATGQDLVLLSAEIVAVPNVPAADLVLHLTRVDTLKAGQNASYTVSVSSAGPSTEPGPIVVKDTLPAGMSFVGGAGTGWSCSAAGQAVTCSYAGSLPKGATLPDLTLTVLPTAQGSYTHSASVAGAAFDYIGSNNSDSDTASAAAGAQAYVFTDSACQAGVAFGSAGQCKLLAADQRFLAASVFEPYLTAVSGGLPVARGTSANSASLSFAVTCVSPLKTAGVKPSMNGVTLPVCADGPAAPAAASTAFGSAQAIAFGANAASSKLSLLYADVGKLQLSVKDASAVVSSSPTLVSRPAKLNFPAYPTAADASSGPFRTAGSAFPVQLEALMSNGQRAPNFGNGDASIDLAASVPADAAIAQAMGNFPALTFSGLDTAASGLFSGSAVFSEVGVIALSASVRGGYFGVNDVSAAAATLGRFYPASFKTVPVKKFDCLPASMACPAAVVGAVYAAQRFDVAVIPLDAAGNALKNFRGVFGRQVELAAFDAAGSLGANPPASPAGAALSNNIAAAAAIPTDGSALVLTPAYALPVPYNRAAPAVRNWTAPTPIFLRATSTDSAGTVVTSNQGAASPEGGITVVNGRLGLTPAYGSELLRLPVTMEAQYWSSGGAWVRNLADSGSVPSAMLFSNCRKNLLVSSACYTGLQMAPKDTVFASGRATVWVQPPGAGRSGSAMIAMTGAPAWLPSMLSQATFGTYKSPVIYVRELF